MPRTLLTPVLCFGLWLCSACRDALPPPPPPPPVVPVVVEVPVDAGVPEAAPDVVVISVVGSVQIRRGDGPSWEEAREGDRIAANDSVRTGLDSDVELKSSQVRFRVREGSEVKVRKVERSRLNARMTGHVDLEVPKGSESTVEVDTEGSNALVRSSGGRFSMTSDGSGVVAVATQSGVADLESPLGSVSVREGQVARVVANKPTAATTALNDVFLAVKWGESAETRAKLLPVQGAAPVGSRVRVQGAFVRVDRKGHFKTRVPLQQGRQVVSVTVTDVSGKKTRKEQTFVVDRSMRLEGKREDW